MQSKEAQYILNCSRMTILNWVRSGKLKLDGRLDNGYMDINPESVYAALATRNRRTNEDEYSIVIAGGGDDPLCFKVGKNAADAIVEYARRMESLHEKQNPAENCTIYT